MALKEPALLDRTGTLSQGHFSSEVLGRAFGQLVQRHVEGHEISLGILTDFTSEEMAHIAGISQRHQGPVNEQAFHDCIRTILDQHGKASITTDADMLEQWKKMKESKGINR